MAWSLLIKNPESAPSKTFWGKGLELRPSLWPVPTSPVQSRPPASSCRLPPGVAAGWRGGRRARWLSGRRTRCSRRWSQRTGSVGSSRPPPGTGSPAAPSCRGNRARRAGRELTEACSRTRSNSQQLTSADVYTGKSWINLRSARIKACPCWAQDRKARKRHCNLQ